MNDLAFIAYRQAIHYSGGWTDWIAHRVVSALIHSVIYSVVFRMMRQLTISQAVVIAVVVLACLFMWGRSRDRRGW